MAVSRNTGYSETDNYWKGLFDQLSRYDLLLAAIPLVFALALVAYALFTVPFNAAIAASAVVSVLLVADALYFNAPTES